MDRKKVLNSIVYRWMERFGFQLFVFIVQVFLVRVLNPTDFGIMAIMMAFVGFLQVFIQSGISTALIQKKEVKQEDYNTAITVNIMISLILYILLYLLSPLISDFYDNPDVVIYLRALSLMLLPNAIYYIVEAKLIREMNFKFLFFVSTVGSVLSGCLSIFMAFSGFGMWALIFQQLINRVIVIILIIILGYWSFSFKISLSIFQELWKFGSNVLFSGVIDSIYSNIQNIFIGKKYNSSTLGYYNQGKLIPSQIIDNINSTIQSVLLPVFSNVQDNKERVKVYLRQTIRLSCYIVFPLMFGLAIVAYPLVIVLLTDKWIESTPYLIIFCFIFALWPIHTAHLQMLNSIGKSDLYLRLEIKKKVVGFIVLLLSIIVFNSPIMIATGSLVSSLVSVFINSKPSVGILGYTYREQIYDILPSFGTTILMCLSVNLLTPTGLSPMSTICLQVIFGAILYIIFSIVFKISAYRYIIDMLRSFIKKEKWYGKTEK